MNTTRHIGHHHRHFGFSYPISLAQKVYSILLGPLIIVFVLFILLKLFPAASIGTTYSLSFTSLFVALFYTVLRLLAAYILALIVAIPLSLLATSSVWMETIFLPLFDILESIPILAFFPVLILLFIKFNFLNGAAIFILFLSMLWNIVFTVAGGLKMIPTDVIGAAKVFKVKHLKYFTKIILPSIFPQIITGSILAVAQGWNLIIVAEVIHTYMPGATASQDLFGIGSVLVRAAATGESNLFIGSIVVMVLAIAALNFFVWQKLIHYGQRFKFE